MGVHGWRILNEDQVLWGKVVEWNISDSGGIFNIGADYDWCLKVVPDTEYLHLLRNPGVREPNSNGLIECEIKPPDSLGSGANEIDTTDRGQAWRFLADLVSRQVRIRGAWAADCSHSYLGNNMEFGNCDRGKTEIHQIYTISCVIRYLNASTHRYKFFAFKETKGNHPLRNRLVNETFRIALPLGKWSVAGEAGDGLAEYSATTDADSRPVLDVTISVPHYAGMIFTAVDVPVPPKQTKEKDTKEHAKDSKDNKDRKDNIKDTRAKPGEKDGEVEPIWREADLPQRLEFLASRVDAIEQQLGIGRAFIGAQERPDVAEELLTGPAERAGEGERGTDIEEAEGQSELGEDEKGAD